MDDSRCLLDTHTLVWVVGAPERLSAKVKAIIEAGGGITSVVSLWELIIKRERPDAPVRQPSRWWTRYVASRGIEVLPIRLAHVTQLELLPELHKDPFDRMLIAQAVSEGVALITCDPAIRAYSVSTIW